MTKFNMSHIAKFYTVALSGLVPGSAIWSLMNSCPTAASICAILVIALAVEKYRLTLDKKSGNDERMEILETEVVRLNTALEQINIKEFITRSDEVRVLMNNMKTHNPYRRPL